MATTRQRLEQALNREISLLEWNEKTETLLQESPERQLESSSVPEGDDDGAMYQSCSRRLALLLLDRLGNKEEMRNEESIAELAAKMVDKWTHSSDEYRIRHADDCELVLRTCKNWLRWNLQIYQPTHGHDSIQDFKNIQMLELYVLFLDYFSELRLQEAERSVAIILFYATFDPISGSDDVLQQSLKHLLEDLHLMDRLLRLLVKAPTVSLALSLVRNVHNLVGTMPQASTLAFNASVQVDSSIVPWVIPGTITFRSLLRDLVLWTLQSDPPFPGDARDIRAELVTEILRTFYALRVGSFLSPDNERLELMMRELLQLDTREDRSYECQLSAVSMLMDANPTFGQYLIQSPSMVTQLLVVLERQLSAVIDSNRIDNAAAASLTPILAVLFKFSKAHNAFRKIVQDRVFPPQDEVNFRKLVEKSAASHGGKPAKNMAPIDAPEGTLRAKLIRLLTWPQGHIKRFTGELLWILCDGKTEEFIHRVGLGNALPMLNEKGLVQLPSQLHQE